MRGEKTATVGSLKYVDRKVVDDVMIGFGLADMWRWEMI